MESRYTHGHHGTVVDNHATRTAANSAAFLLPHLQPDMRLLDVGCGPGSITIELAEMVGSAVGIDAADAAIEHARSAAAAGTTHVRFEVADVYDLPFDDQSFDVVYAHQVLQHLGDPVSALVEARRVLAPGGLIAVRDADYGTMVHSPHDDRIDHWLELYHALTRRHGSEADAGRYLLEWVTDAGFVDAVATTSTWTYASPEAVTAWRDLWVSRLTEARMGHDLLDLGMADAGDIRDLADAWDVWAAADTPFFAFLHGEVIAVAPA